MWEEAELWPGASEMWVTVSSSDCDQVGASDEVLSHSHSLSPALKGTQPGHGDCHGAYTWGGGCMADRR